MGNWYIGQDIVAIKDHIDGQFKEGETFVVKALTKAFCKCQKVLIDVGFKKNYNTLRCGQCNTEKYVGDITQLFYSENNFAPLDTLADITEITEHLANTKPFEVNQKSQ